MIDLSYWESSDNSVAPAISGGVCPVGFPTRHLKAIACLHFAFQQQMQVPLNTHFVASRYIQHVLKHLDATLEPVLLAIWLLVVVIEAGSNHAFY